MTNFQPISNLPFLSKIVEKYVSMQLTQNLEAFILFYIQTTIGVLQVSLHRVCYHPHSSWHFWIFWLGAHNSPRLSGRACGLWHCWPWFPFFPSPWKIIWCWLSPSFVHSGSDSTFHTVWLAHDHNRVPSILMIPIYVFLMGSLSLFLFILLRFYYSLTPKKVQFIRKTIS